MNWDAMPVSRRAGQWRTVILTCLPIARRIPAVTPPRPSNTWKSATMGRMEATSSTTSVVSHQQELAMSDEQPSG